MSVDSPTISPPHSTASPGKRLVNNKVSLVVIRLEIDDDQALIDCEYECPSVKRARRNLFEDKRSMKKTTGGLQKGPSSSKANVDPPPPNHRGGRTSGDLSVETYEIGQSGTVVDSPVSFTAGNPFVQKSHGLIHLYKQDTTLPMMSEQVERSDTIVMLTVPAWMSAQELLQFLRPMSDAYVRVRIVRDKSPQNYMVIVNFRSQEMADVFYRTYNTAQYNSIEPNLCHLAYVEKVEVLKEGKGGSAPLEGHTELPTCTVCLERMDESVDGILTILCNHSFHSSCLAKWTDESCPVCRYSQTPKVEPDHACCECGRKADLWICLICGHVGCGRYELKHAYDHFMATSHTFSLQVGTARVWDYAGDSYVHRLIAGNADGKPVEVDRPHRCDDDEGGKQDSEANMESEEKLEGVTLEYSYLLTSQLEDQRRYFTQMMDDAMEKNAKKMTDMDNSFAEQRATCSSLQARLDADRHDRAASDKKHASTIAKLNKAIEELKNERQMNELLRGDQQRWQVTVRVLEEKLARATTEHKEEVAALEEQLRDIMFHFEGQAKIKAATEENAVDHVSKEEVQEASIEIVPATPKGRKKKK